LALPPTQGQQAVQLRCRVEFIALACVGCIGRIAQGVIFSDFICTFAMSLMIFACFELQH
ncbi:MAG: hypothetical protein IKH59_00795, partial [Bacteroidaceae bacterium]|nr:hypothetical protein [Bacteroidaceae bacterium]